MLKQEISRVYLESLENFYRREYGGFTTKTLFRIRFEACCTEWFACTLEPPMEEKNLVRHTFRILLCRICHSVQVLL